VVALSGGVDSRVMLEVLCTLQPSWRLDLILAHVNYGLRGLESERDERFVRELGEQLQLSVVVGNAKDLKAGQGQGVSLQEAARTWRYRFLEDVKQRRDAQRIAIGHTRSDQAETVLMRLLRGTGLTGLAGIPLEREGGVVRPLLETRRDQVLAIARRMDLTWIEDSSNATGAYLRNRIRHTLIPLMSSFNPQLEESLAQVAETARREDAFLERMTQAAGESAWIQWREDGIRLSRSEFLSLDPAIRFRLLRLLYQRLQRNGSAMCRLEHVHLEVGMTLIEEGRGTRQASWPGEVCLTVEPGWIDIGQKGLSAEGWEGELLLEIPGTLDLPDGGVLRAHHVAAETFERSDSSSRLCWLDENSVESPMRVRCPQPGDVFHPLGAPGITRLSEFFVRQKVPRRERNRIPLVLSGSVILWIAGVRSAAHGSITSVTRRAIQIEWIPPPRS